MPDPADVSVVIPAYEAAASIGNALRSVAQQSLPAREVIVVDDGSSDETAAAAEALREQLLPTNLKVVRQENKGAGAARNRALNEATSEFVAFLDADDEWLPEKLKRSMHVMEEGQFDLIAHDYFDVTPEGDRHIDCRGRFSSGADPYITLYLKGYIPSISVVTRLEHVRRVGGFDETLRNAQDFDLWLKLLRDEDVKFTVLGEALARYNHTPGGIMSHTERRIQCCTRIAWRYIDALAARRQWPLPILLKRMAVIYGEAVRAYMAQRNVFRACITALRFGLVAGGALLRYTTSSRGELPR